MKDLAMTEYEGDIRFEQITKSDGTIVYDFVLTEDNEDIKQLIYNRLVTQNPDWHNHPIMGADLEEMIGKSNTRENAKEIEKRILKSLLYLDPVTQTLAFDPATCSVRAIPVNPTTIMVLITTSNSNMFINFDYSRGISEVGYL
jgi:hypothetical protein